MNWKKELEFKLDNAEGTLKIVYTPLSVKLFQNDKEIKKKGSFGGAKYEINTIDGGQETIKLLTNAKNGYTVKTANGETIYLEEKLSAGDLSFRYNYSSYCYELRIYIRTGHDRSYRRSNFRSNSSLRYNGIVQYNEERKIYWC
ncbi:hypothetical protein [Dysgonomonas sp. 216]|uniref:hypothetical protein n=1 Tax=Dysgonomonas sp. 216 TaxID=2302934 RepID=UPI0013D530C2|nr:hypothetical protein [Dysgonomonas sp. 216]